MAMSHCEPWVRYPGLLTTWEAMSNTRLPNQAPMGTVTSIGCSGCPYAPVSSALTGCFACCIPVATKSSH